MKAKIVRDGTDHKVFINDELKYVAEATTKYESWLLARNFVLGYAAIMYGFTVEEGEDVQES